MSPSQFNSDCQAKHGYILATTKRGGPKYLDKFFKYISGLSAGSWSCRFFLFEVVKVHGCRGLSTMF